MGRAPSASLLGVDRILPRHHFEARVKIEIVRGGETITTEAWARDMSESGLGAFAGFEMLIGELATLTIPLRPGLEVVVPAKVSRNLGTEYGFQFTALSGSQRDHIRRALAASKVIPYHPDSD